MTQEQEKGKQLRKYLAARLQVGNCSSKNSITEPRLFSINHSAGIQFEKLSTSRCHSAGILSF
jgi:hypothetical protein